MRRLIGGHAGGGIFVPPSTIIDIALVGVNAQCKT